MNHGPSRASLVATVIAVAVVAAGAGALLAWGPDPERVTSASEEVTTSPSEAASVSATPSESATRSPTTATPEASGSADAREHSKREVRQMRAARAKIPDRVIIRQLRNAAERIAQEEPMPNAAPTPTDIEPDSNRALGYQLMLEFGFDADQWPALDALWTRESGWNHLAENPSSGAYGIPQSLPASKMAVVGDDYRTNPRTQIQWGLAYISARYGVPDRAWAHSERVNWY